MRAHGETSPHGPIIAVIGTGGLARAVCYALAAATQPVRVLVLGRDPVKTAEICWISGARAIGTSDAPPAVTFQPVTVDLAAAGALAEALAEARPTAVLVAASRQSPWERINAPSAWTALIQRAGFGLTLPLQAVFAREAGRALAEHHPSGWLLNGCFPDAVNPALAGLGVAPLCGIGNVALTATGLQSALSSHSSTGCRSWPTTCTCTHRRPASRRYGPGSTDSPCPGSAICSAGSARPRARSSTTSPDSSPPGC